MPDKEYKILKSSLTSVVSDGNEQVSIFVSLDDVQVS